MYRTKLVLGKLEVDMSDGVRVWAVDESDSLKEMEPSKLDYEERIENWICDNVSVLVPDDAVLLVIGRQVRTSSGGSIDLLCMEDTGDLVIVELKRNRTPREVTAQALDYASWVQGLSAQQVEEIAAAYLKGRLEDVFEASFPDRVFPEVINGQHSIKIVAAQIDDSTERIIRYLSGRGIAINFVRFHLFKSSGGKELLVRTFTVPPDQAEENCRNGPLSKRLPIRTLQDKVNDESFEPHVREFLKQRLSDPHQMFNRTNRALYYRVSGAVRFEVWIKRTHAKVKQRGRFEKDERFWGDHLSTCKVRLRDKGRNLSFDLYTTEDLRFFQATMEQEIAGFGWMSAEVEENEEEEIGDEG